MSKRDFASLFAGALQGAESGGDIATGLGKAKLLPAAGMTAAGMAPGPWTPWLIGGGLAMGALSGYLGSKADEENAEEDPVAQEARRRARGLSMFRNNIGRALRTRTGSDFEGMLRGTP